MIRRKSPRPGDKRPSGARVHKARRPPPHAGVRGMYDDDDDTLEIPDTALGGAKD